MRSFSFDVTKAKLVYLLTITRLDGQVIRVGTWPIDITIGGFTWVSAPGLKVGDIVEKNDGTAGAASFEIGARTDGLFDLYDIGNGLFNAASVEIDLTNGDNPVARDFRFIGEIGNIDFTSVGSVAFDLRNKYGFPRNIFIRQFQAMCAADFGSFALTNGCKIPIRRPDVARNTTYVLGDTARFRFDTDGTPDDYHNAYLEATTGGTTAGVAPAFTDGIGDTITDGIVIWTVRNAWERFARIGSLVNSNSFNLDSLPDPRAADNSWYAPGRILFETGYSKNRSERIATWDGATFRVTTFMPIGDLIDVNDWVTIWPACDFTIAMCVEKYDNAKNFRGFPYSGGAKYQNRSDPTGFFPHLTIIDSTFVSSGNLGGGGVFMPAVEFAGGEG